MGWFGYASLSDSLPFFSLSPLSLSLTFWILFFFSLTNSSDGKSKIKQVDLEMEEWFLSWKVQAFELGVIDPSFGEADLIVRR